MTVLFSHQSQKITYGEWMDLITLCLAPLLVHIIAGVPTPTILTSKKLSWHDKFGFYNPTSIMWRYFAILDRRVRAKSWSAMEMAASNAVFWTDGGWNGSEYMIWSSRLHCRIPPSQTHIDIISGSAAATLVVALQGISAIYALLMGVIFPKSYSYGDTVSISKVFIPLTIFGLFRLPIAFWLSDDYKFSFSKSATANASISIERLSEAEMLTSDGEQEEGAFHRTSSWRGYLHRTIFMGILVALWGITMYYISP
ncbi:uncharacterized protein LY89DRAFT_755949 [Mollisia scopiformis]|uniref:Uncharacterized protein n=1 Tax=Mollisia scopiformis TaxID=149040 RepID=A0A194WYS8_MOLSC|nr:uncharacterized protein LY89DRAFT_755949 [Mollisia scopiformis]KUJ12844.1 hypothetical protein LY89DRAFT_755949 [Mollisia scopiformis]